MDKAVRTSEVTGLLRTHHSQPSGCRLLPFLVPTAYLGAQEPLRLPSPSIYEAGSIPPSWEATLASWVSCKKPPMLPPGCVARV